MPGSLTKLCTRWPTKWWGYKYKVWELKLRATHLVVAVCCVGLSCYLCFFELCVLTLTPLDNVCFLDLTEAFAVTMKVVLFFTTLFIAPVVCFHGWGFVSPGLTGAERQPWAFLLSTIPKVLWVSLVFSHVLSHWLCVWFLGFSRAPAEGPVLQYIPLISGFVWFKLKCFGFVCVAGSLAGFGLYWLATCAVGRTLVQSGRSWFYSGAVLLGAFFAAGSPQWILSLCIILLCELWFLSSYIKAALKRKSTRW